MSTFNPSADLVRFGSDGLDEILGGGLPGRHLYLLEGGPGTGKTTLALLFLLEGAKRGEKVLYVTLSQTRRELVEIAESHGWSLDGVVIEDLETSVESRDEFAQTVLQTADIQLDQTRESIEAALRKHDPKRLVYDSLLEVRHLSADMLRYRREMLGLKQFIAERGIATLAIDTLNESGESDTELEGIVHGIIHLDKFLPEYGTARRRVEVTKMRGVAYHDGWHDMAIRRGTGVEVYPRVLPQEAEEVGVAGLVTSGVDKLDAMLDGGMEAGTTTIMVGQAGVGKSTLSSLYAFAALKRGEAVCFFLFEERRETFFRRCEGLGMDMRPFVESGLLRLYDFAPADISPGEFARMVQKDLDDADISVVVIDSFTGYLASLPHASQAVMQLQNLLKYLTRRGVLVIIVVAQHGLLGDNVFSDVDVSFLGDTILLLRMHEEMPHVTRSVTAVKKRHGSHDMTSYRLKIEPGRISIGPFDGSVIGDR